MQTVLVCSAWYQGPGCLVKQDYVVLPHICHSSWGISQFSVIQLQDCGLLRNYILRKNAERTDKMAYNFFSLVLWWRLVSLIQAKVSSDMFGLVFILYNNNSKAEIAAQEGDNALFMHLFNLLFVTQPLRWSSDSNKQFVSTTAFTEGKFLEFVLTSTQRNSTCGKKRVAGKQKLLICYHSLWKRSSLP